MLKSSQYKLYNLIDGVEIVFLCLPIFSELSTLGGGGIDEGGFVLTVKV